MATSSNDTDELSLVPGMFDVTFGDALWRNVALRADETVVLQPAVIQMQGIPDVASSSPSLAWVPASWRLVRDP
ncbi:hypothetical protein [Halochromatium glycolicum]|uniref:hypothetical protein n=1 Tax=Halochromatium glycolicum TaxID=85075 RepID=UPI00190ABF0A|nr:hypothetical protein [Halochromatium glycolicum]